MCYIDGMTKRVNQIVLLVSVCGFSWLAMQAVHELGHVLGAWMTGGTVTAVVLHPAVFSRTDVSPNPRPLVVAWMGPIVGVVVPLLMYVLLRPLRKRSMTWVFLARWFAGFCLLANGLYLGAGSFEGVGDAGDLLLHGSPQWLLIVFGLLTVPAGLAMWHGQGEQFGLGKAQGQVARHHVLIAVLLFVGMLLVEFGLSLL